MKLFRKIFLQVFCGMLLLSAGLLVYFLWNSANQNLKDVTAYEQQLLQSQKWLFRSRIARSDVGQAEPSVQDAAVVTVFREVFGSRGAVYKNDEELFNVTGYQFDCSGLRQTCRGESFDSYEIGVSKPQRTDGRWLVLFLSDESLAGFAQYSMVFYKDVTDIYVRTEQLLRQGLLFTAALLAAVGLLLYRGIYRVIRPMIELKQMAAAIADGAYESRVPVRGRDEIGELTMSFNRMAERVELHMEELSLTNERQRRLLGSLAHELKTPLTAIIGYADTLLTVRISERNRVQALEYIRSEGRRLSVLSEKMLELTGLYESGTSGLEKKATEVETLLGRLKDLTAYRLKERGVQLLIFCEPTGLQKEMDADLVMSLLMNLVDNAYKASGEQGIIRVRADADGFAVEDSGRGIPAEDLARVTEAFYMVDKSRGRSAGGAGLGLALCSQIAMLHGWELEIESEEGRGTRVSVRW